MVETLLLVGALSMAVVGWFIFMWATTPIDGVNEPGLYRKLKDQEGKRK